MDATPLGSELGPPGKVAIVKTNVGLGDNLLYSTLPELYAAQGVPVFLYAGPHEDPQMLRNQEILELVWERNPYVAGASSKPPNAGEVKLPERDWTVGSSPIGQIERAHGFPGTGLWPQIYYQPRPDPRAAGKVLIDISSSSLKFHEHVDTVTAYLNFVAHRMGYRPENCLAVTFAKIVSGSCVKFPTFEQLVVEDIYRYCDAIFSCRALVTVESGAQALASAIRRDRPTPRIVALFSVRGFNERQFVLPNVEYYVTGALDLGDEFPLWR